MPEPEDAGGEDASPPDVPSNRFERRPRLTMAALWMFSAIACSVGFDACYRFQVIDFYGPELRFENRRSDLQAGRDQRETILAMGDSFTAWPSSYPSLIAARDPASRVVNSGVSGFTLRQVARLLPRRLAEFNPDALILQLFSGNDLIEMRHPIAWTRVSPLKNLVWLASDSLESVGFVNYRVGSILGGVWRHFRAADGDQGHNSGFKVESYSAHEKTLIAAEPDYVEQQLQVSPRYRSAYEDYLATLQAVMNAAMSSSRRVIIMVVPHPLQIHDRYLSRYRALGGRVAAGDLARNASSPFLDGVARIISSHPRARLVDPVGALREKEQEGDPVFRDTDLHLNPAGQTVLADLLLEELRKIR